MTRKSSNFLKKLTKIQNNHQKSSFLRLPTVLLRCNSNLIQGLYPQPPSFYYTHTVAHAEGYQLLAQRPLLLLASLLFLRHSAACNKSLTSLKRPTRLQDQGSAFLGPQALMSEPKQGARSNSSLSSCCLAVEKSLAQQLSLRLPRKFGRWMKSHR